VYQTHRSCNSLHPVSSLPSVQSRVPSQRSEDRMHWPLLQQNRLEVHRPAWVFIINLAYKYPGTKCKASVYWIIVAESDLPTLFLYIHALYQVNKFIQQCVQSYVMTTVC